MTLIEIVMIFFVHWIADFVLQSDEDAKGKSKYVKNLINHTASYSLFWFTPLLIYSSAIKFFHINTMGILHDAFDFVCITFVLHTITDYFTSRLNAILWEDKRVHDFFVSVGFDQVLHYIQLFITFYIIYK